MKKRLKCFADLIWIGAGIGTLAAFAARHGWFFELLCNFRFHYTLLLAAGLCGALWIKSGWRAAACSVLLVANLLVVIPALHGKTAEAAPADTIKMMSVNLLQENHWHGFAREAILEEDADIVLVIEVDYIWKEKLLPLAEKYPYSEVYARNDGMGIGLFSRIPWESVEVKQLIKSSVFSIEARFIHGGRSWKFLGIHPPAPLVPAFAAERNEQLKAVAGWAQKQFEPTVIMGDFNTTGWSPYFRDLLEQGDLRDSREGFGRQPTWPYALRGLGIAIDHCLVSEDVVVYHRRTGAHVGSDHVPVVVEIGFKS